MHSNKLILPLLLAMATVACSEEDFKGWEAQKEVTIVAGHAQPQVSRTQIDGETDDPRALHILWSVGDQLGVFGSETMNVPFSGSYTEAVEEAEFTGTMNADDTPLYAYYPYREGVTVNDYTRVPVSINLDTRYNSELTYLAANDIKIGTYTGMVEGAKSNFVFSPMVSMLRFVINVNGVTGVENTERLLEFELSPSESSEVAGGAWGGDFTMNLAKPSAGLTPVEGTATESLSVTFWDGVDVATGLDLTNSATFYAAIAPTAFAKNQKLAVTIKTSKHIVNLTTTVQATLVAGTSYYFPITLKNATAENGMTTEEWTPGEPEGGELLPANVLSDFYFTPGNNSGSILATEAYYNGSTTTTRTVSRMPAEEKVLFGTAIDENGREYSTVNICIPYLYNFTLVPSFMLGGTSYNLYHGDTLLDGKTAVDFSNPVTLTVKDAKGASRDYVVTVTNTGLPVVVLNSNGYALIGNATQSQDQNASDTNQIRDFLHTRLSSKNADFDDLMQYHKIAIYDKEGGYNLPEAVCGFRWRGNSSSNFPKKPIAIKLDSKAGVLGMPSHKRWVLLANNYDRSLVRNLLSYKMAEVLDGLKPATEGSAYWQPHGKNVELVLDGCHVGNYLLAEQIKIDKNRLNIQDCYEDVLKDYNKGERTDAPATSNCGYLLEFDDNYDEVTKVKTNRLQLPCMAKDEIANETIKSYIFDYVQKVEDAVNGNSYESVTSLMDITSVIDWWIVNEIAMNNEYRHPKSVYMYKDGEGKLFAGPVWDFDFQTYPNPALIPNFDQTYSFSYTSLLYTNATSYDTQYYMWYPDLFNNFSSFRSAVKSRWSVVQGAIEALAADGGEIDRWGAENKVSDEYNQAMWPVDHEGRISWMAHSGDEDMTYDEVIENLKLVLKNRVSGLGSAINGLK